MKKSSLSSKAKSIPRDGRLSTDSILRFKESSKTAELLPGGLYGQLMFCS